jgi:putative transposase
VLKDPGRPRVGITEQERKIIRDARKRFGVGACYLAHLIRRCYGTAIHHMKVYRVLKEEGLLYASARRHIRRRWIRYERAYSNELWHTDWHDMEHPSYRGKKLIVYEDDASRFIVGYGLFDEEASKHAVRVLDAALQEHGRPVQILSDRGSPFYAPETEAREKGLTEFERYLMRNHIQQILCGVRHPETNGKLEKLFDTLETGLERGFLPIERCIEWYNTVKPHGSLDLERCETPVQAYYGKMRLRQILTDPAIIVQGGGK